MGGLLYGAGDPGFPDDDAERAQTVPGDAVRGGGWHPALRFQPRAGRAALREPFGGAAARRGCGEHARQGGQRRRGPAVRHASAALPRDPRASRRRRRRIRRSRTTARASTAGCSRTACSAACRRRATSPTTIRCSRRSAAPSRTSRRRRKTSSSSGIDGCSAPNYAVPLDRLALAIRPARRAPRRCRLRTCAADPGRRHDGASGNGVRRAPERSRAHARRDAATGWRRSVPKACRASAFAARASASRSRSPTATSARCGRSWPRSWSSCELLDAHARADLAHWFEPVVHNYRGIVTGRILSSVVLDKMPRLPTTLSADAAITLPRDELTVHVVVCRCKRAPHGAPDEFKAFRGVSSLKPDAAPAVRRA